MNIRTNKTTTTESTHSLGQLEVDFIGESRRLRQLFPSLILQLMCLALLQLMESMKIDSKLREERETEANLLVLDDGLDVLDEV